MVSPTALKSHEKEWIMEHPVGTGPFKLVSFQRDVSLKLERFQDYWQKGKPYLDGLEFKFVVDPFTALAAFKRGEGQILMEPNVKDLPDLKGAGYVITKCPAYAASLAGDSRNPESPFADVRVRQAVAYAINKEAIVKALGYGIWEVASQPAVPMNYWYNPDIKGYSYDPDKAKMLLKDAGYPDGLKTTMIIPTSKYGDIWVQVQNDLQRAGIDAKLQNMGDAAFTSLRAAGWKNSLILFDGFFLSIGADEGQMIRSFLSSKAPFNVSVNCPADYEEKLAQIASERDLEKRKVLVQELMKIVIDKNCMVTPITLNYAIAAKSPKAHGEMLYEIWAGQWTPADAWLSQ
jgi:peptide/nickel transport system substrate-binding protein